MKEEEEGEEKREGEEREEGKMWQRDSKRLSSLSSAGEKHLCTHYYIHCVHVWRHLSSEITIILKLMYITLLIVYIDM